MKICCSCFKRYSGSCLENITKTTVVNILSAAALTTVEFIEKFDSLFDIFNSSTIINKKSYRQTFFIGAQRQLQFLQEILFDMIICHT